LLPMIPYDHRRAMIAHDRRCTVVANDDLLPMIPYDHGRAMIANDDLLPMIPYDHGRAMIAHDRYCAMIADDVTATTAVAVTSHRSFVHGNKCQTG
jgi:hypothetical protein